MPTNIIIGVGGTGAKIVESVIHTCAAGLGPEGLTVGFVDQDQSNGNVTRSLDLLNKYVEARRLWRAENSSNRLGEQTELLKTELRSLLPGQEVWVPHRDQQTTLAMVLGEASMPQEDRHLFDLLFAAGEEEQDMPLDEGYRGRPNIGAAAMTARVGEDVEFWRTLIQKIEQAKGGEDVRLVLAGSVFGGTGAAGFPTLARLIRNQLRERRVTRNVKLGGILMLPYFAFNAPEKEEGVQANVARREQLLLQSQGALKYYHNLFKDEGVFDELYFVGWNRMFDLGYHRPGKAEQANPPLAPELLAALGVVTFLTKEIEQEGQNRVFVSSRQQDDVLSWSDLPSPDPNRPDAPFERLGQMLRFATAWLYWRPLLSQRGGFKRIFGNDPWYRVQGLDKVDFKTAPPDAELRKLTEYLEKFLWWAACIEHYSPSARTRFDLWRTTPLVAQVTREENPTDPYQIAQALREEAFGPAFDQVVVNHAAADALPSASELIRKINEQAAPGENRGLGVMVASLHQYSHTGRA
ncbi:tubulin-like doman-containing protein [Phenylobacterium sp.]|jgi:hypothetical protein|uniref:tubulin-like doman-containing protein n=1 Tax=Phenylobacterium sp. TaxID=1871053 RepID=UPI002F9320EC